MVTSSDHSTTIQALKKDINDANTILAIPSLCDDLASPAKKVLQKKQELLSFLERPLPAHPKFEGPRNYDQIEALWNHILDGDRSVDAYTTAIVKTIDFFADPNSVPKGVFAEWRAKYILDRMTMNNRHW